MILSKGALAAAGAVAKVDGLPVIIRREGGVVGIARRALVEISAPRAAVKQSLRGVFPEGVEELAEDCGISSEAAGEIVKAAPSQDRLFAGLLEHVSLTEQGATEVHAEVSDGKRRKTVLVKRVPRLPPGWREEVEKVKEQSRGHYVAVVNLRRLQAVLDAVMAVAGKAGDEVAVRITIGDEALGLEAEDPRTGTVVRAWCSLAVEKKTPPPKKKII